MTMPIVKDKDYHRALVESLAAAQAEVERLRAWAEDEQRGRHKAEEDRMNARSENARLTTIVNAADVLRSRWLNDGHGLAEKWQAEFRKAREDYDEARNALEPKP
jgi:hypothetical protein